MYLVKETGEESIPAKYYKPFTQGWIRELRISTNPHYSVSVSYLSPSGLRLYESSELDLRFCPDLRWDNFLFEPRSISMPPYEQLVPEDNTDNSQLSIETVDYDKPSSIKTVDYNKPSGIKTVDYNKPSGIKTVDYNKPSGIKTVDYNKPSGIKTVDYNKPSGIKTVHYNKPYGLNKSCDTASSRLIMRRKMLAAKSVVNGGNSVYSPSLSVTNLHKRQSEDNLDDACPRKKMIVATSHAPVQPLQMDNMEMHSLMNSPDEESEQIFPDRPTRRPKLLQRSKPRLMNENGRVQKVTFKTQNNMYPCLEKQLMIPSSREHFDTSQSRLDSLNINATSVWAVGEPVDETWRKLDAPIVVSGDKLKRLVERSIRGVTLERNSVEVTDASPNLNMPSQFPRPCSTHCVLFIHEPPAITTPGKLCVSCGLLYHNKCAVHWWQQLSLKNSVILYSEKWKQVKRRHCPTCFTKLAENIMVDVLQGVAKRTVATKVSLTYENPFSESLKNSLPKGKFWLVASARLFPPEVVGIGDFKLSDKLAIEYQAYRIRLPYTPMFDMLRNPQPLVVVHGERVFNLTSRDVVYEKDVVSIKLKGNVRISSRRQQVVIYPPTAEIPVSVVPNPPVNTSDFLQIPTVDPVSEDEKADDSDADCQVISDDIHCQVISDDEPEIGVIEIEVDESAEESIEIPVVVEKPREPSCVEAENEEEFVSCLETDDVDTKNTEKLQLIRNLDQKRRTSGEAQMRLSDGERRVTRSEESEVNHAHSNGIQNSENVQNDLNSLSDIEDAPKSEGDCTSIVNIGGEVGDYHREKGDSEADFELYLYPSPLGAELVISDDEDLEVLSTESMYVESVGMDCDPSEGTGDGIDLPEDSVTVESSTPPSTDGLQRQLSEEDVKPVKQRISAVIRTFCINDWVNHQIFDSIFSHLDTPSLLRCRVVCRQWKRIIDSSPKLCGGRYHARPGYSLRLYDETALLIWLLQKEVSHADLRNLVVSSPAVIDDLLVKLQELVRLAPSRFYLKELAVKSCSRDVVDSSTRVLSKLQLSCEDIVESLTENYADSRTGDCQDSQQTQEC